MSISPLLLLFVVAAYFGVLLLISRMTAANANDSDFFIGSKQSSWIMVAIGMIGTSLSGVTFISVPGTVGAGGANQAFAYMQMVFGYLLGYFVIATVLMPIYYRYNLTSIYTFLEQRMGTYSYKTGAVFFQISRLLGCSMRVYLVALVIQSFILGPLGVPFWVNIVLTLGMILIYSSKGGIKTIVVTDTVQTLAMLTAVVMTIYFLGDKMGLGIGGIISEIQNSAYSQMFFFEGGWSDPNNFFKQFISGALIAIVMTGLDQDMMQKNLSCKNIGDAQKNMFTFSVVLVFANLLFIALGALIWIFATREGIEIPTRIIGGETVAAYDLLYPTIALEHLPPMAGIIFFIGLIAAAYSSADSALTALTTSFCIDFLNFEKKENTNIDLKKRRNLVHLMITGLVFGLVMVFYWVNERSVINLLFQIASYTYGPLLGLFTFSIVANNLKVRDKLVPIICLMAPILSRFIELNPPGGFQFGFLIIALNGLLTFIGLYFISEKRV